MIIDVIPILKELTPQKVYGKTAIVLDIFRCTSSIVTALANGCKEVIPVSSPGEAYIIGAKYSRNSYLLAGETNGVKIPDFDLGNSPLEFKDNQVRGKKIILATTNGTTAIKLSKPAKHVLIGSFLNINAVCSYALTNHKDVIIICAGNGGNIALEDVMAAGGYVTVLRKYCQDIRFGELARTFYYLFNYFQDSLDHILSTSRSGINLQKLGYGQDLEFCLQKNKYNIVPILKQNSIKLSSNSVLYQKLY